MVIVLYSTYAMQKKNTFTEKYSGCVLYIAKSVRIMISGHYFERKHVYIDGIGGILVLVIGGICFVSFSTLGEVGTEGALFSAGVL